MEHFPPLGGPNSDPTLFNLIQEEQWERAWELVARNPTAPYMSNGRADRDGQRFPLHELCRMVKFMDHIEENEFSDDEEEVFTNDHRERNEEIYKLAKFMILQSQTIQHGFEQQVQEHVLIHSLRESILSLTEVGDRNTPLHVLCHESADTTMIRLLLECAPKDTMKVRAVDHVRRGNNKGCSPLRFLVENDACPFSAFKLMVRCCPMQCLNTIRDRHWNVPLHWAFAAGISPRRIRTLLSRCHDALLTVNSDLKLPFQKYVDEYCEAFNLMDDNDKLALWNDIQALLKVVTDSQDNETWLPLHAIASGINFVSEAIWSIALTFESDRCNTYNQDGLLPLHVAISSPPHGCPTRLEAYLSMMREIMHSYPEAARLPTSRGRLALHIAIESSQVRPVISTLLLEAPHALLTIDPVTGLPPFMLAAVGDTNDLTAVYELLRKDPSILLLSRRRSVLAM